MLKKLILLTLLCSLYLGSMAADPAFVVFYNSGNATKVVAGKYIVLKKGDQLQSTDQLVLPVKTQLVLVCANFSAIQLKEKGNYPVKNLLAKCNQKAESASSAYFEYVWHSFAHPHVAPEKNPSAYMKTYGAASRGRGSLATKLAIDTIFYGGGALPIYWKPAKAAVAQVFTTAIAGNMVVKGKISTRLRVDSLASKLAPGNYYWDWQDEQLPRRNFLKLYSTAIYRLAVNQIIAKVPAAAPAEKAYLTGYQLEEKHFLAEAYQYYQKALQLDQNNQIYKDTLARFKP